MLDTLRTRGNGLTAGFLSVALLASIVTMAVRSPGFDETKVELHESGVWVMKEGVEVARFNLEINEFEAHMLASPGDEVYQDGRDLVLAAPGAISRLDPVGHRKLEAVEIPETPLVDVRGGTGIVLDRSSGALWASDAESLGTTASTDPDQALVPPADDAGDGASVAAVDSSGRVHVYRAGSEVLQTFAAGARATTSPPLELTVARPLERPQMAAVGDSVVLVDATAQVLVVAGGPVVDLASHLGEADDLVLQQSGPEHDHALVAGGGKLLEVPLAGGAPRTVTEGGGAGAVRPVRARGCAWAAFETTALWARTCERTDTELPAVDMEEIPDVEAGQGRLVFRVNRDRVVLNEVVEGTVVTVDLPEVEAVMWDSPNRDENEQTSDPVEEDDDICDPEAPKTPTLAADEVGTRPGRPVVAAVLTNDDIDDCDVARIRVDAPPPVDQAVVDVVNNHSAIQVTPRLPSGTVVIEYVVTTRTGEYPSTLTVTVVPEGSNSDPIAHPDRTFTATGQTLTYDVLANDTDPEGDVLTLIAVEPEGPAPPVEFRADGTVTYRAGGAQASHRYRYTVRDEGDGRAEAILDVQVQATELPPVTRGDFLRVPVDKLGTVQLLANDTDADTQHDDLQVLDVANPPDHLGLSLDNDTGVVTVVPTQQGTFTLEYTVGDRTNEPVPGALVIQVVGNDAGNQDPVAVRDVVRVRPNLPTLIDVLGNDFDRDGDLLAVTEVKPADDAPLAVELLEMRVLRVTAAEGFSQPAVLTYVLSDGTSTVEGTVIVVPYEQFGHNQIPTANPDDAEVKAGRWTSVAVLRNDTDPEGERLTLRDAVVVAQEEQVHGEVFVQGDVVRFRAAADFVGVVELTYTIQDPAQNAATGRVEIQVKPLNSENVAPDALHLEARVFAGEEVVIPVPLVGADRDGDVVAIEGVLPSKPPRLGDVALHPSGLRYRADRGASGSDEFGFVLTDGQIRQVDSTVRVVVVPRPATQLAPVAVPDEVTMRVGTSRFIDVMANDTDPEGEEIALVEDETSPLVVSSDAGTATVRDRQIWFSAPSSIAGGQESRWVNLTYRITDPAGNSDEGLVRIRLLAETSETVPPVVVDDAPDRLVSFGEEVTLDVLENDYDPDEPDRSKMRVTEVTPEQGDDWSLTWTAGGRVTVKTGQTPLLLSYAVADADGNTARALISIPVVASIPPVAVLDDGYTVEVGGRVEIPVLSNDDNSPGKPRSELTLVSVTPGSRGVPRLSGNLVVFEPGDQGGVGEGGFSYLIQNREGEQAVGRVRVTITAPADSPENLPPVFLSPARQLLDAGGPPITLALDRFARDEEGDELSFTATSSDPEALEVVLEGFTLRLSARPAAPDSTASVAVTVTDGQNEPVSGSIPVTISADEGPEPPVARADLGEMRAGDRQDFTVLDNDTVTSGETGRLLTVEMVQGTGSATAGCDGRCISYVSSDEDHRQPVRIRYTITDEWAPEGEAPTPERHSTAELTITVWGRPGRPGTPSGQERSGAVLVTWPAAPGNGLPITGYLVETQSPDGGRAPQRLPADGTQLDVTGLENGKSYRFRVAATNREFGEGALTEESWSDWSPVYETDALPGAPVAVQAAFNRDQNNGGAGGVLHVSWSPPPVNEGSAITEYVVRSSQGGVQRIPAGQTSTSFEGLTNGSPYTFTVSAVNTLGEGPESASSNSEHPTGVPGAPTGVSGSRRPPQSSSDAFVVVTFSPGSDGGDTQTFALEARSGNAGALAVDGVSPGAEVGPLTPGSSYTFHVTASNRAGKSQPGSSGAVTAYALPGTPSAPQVVPGNNSVSVSWGPPLETGGGAVTYSVVRIPDGRVWSNLETTSLVDDAAVNDLSYSYQVRAKNDGDYEGALSGSSPVAIPYGQPNVQSRLEGNTTIVWYWDKQPGVSSYSTDMGTMNGCCEAHYPAGPGVPRTFVATIRAHGPGGERAVTVRSVATIDTRAVAISWGGSADVTDIDSNSPCVNCLWVNVNAVGFTAGRTYTLTCNSNDPYGTDNDTFLTTQITTTGDGSWSGAPCGYGYTGYQVWVSIDGISSNTLPR